jgi:hypothetical protein
VLGKLGNKKMTVMVNPLLEKMIDRTVDLPEERIKLTSLADGKSETQSTVHYLLESNSYTDLELI